MNETIEHVNVIFKTHLDVGFTHYAHVVVQQYMDDFIPRALELARLMNDSDSEHPFSWTVGSWLVYKYLEEASAEKRRIMEDAIEAGHLHWHALPFTTHTELMDAPLFETGIGISKALDARFGRNTIAAKMTDVPGHTRGMIPLLHNAGIEFLHIGVNPASMPPDLPPIFIWRDELSGTEIILMMHGTYGSSRIIPGTREAAAILLTGDNLGPPTPDDVRAIYADLQAEFPNAHIATASLDDVAHSLIKARHELPVITQEIGDSWIHGAGSDPQKIRHYRELLRLRRRWLAEKTVTADDTAFVDFNRALLMIPEHTWGMDEKTHLADHDNYAGADFDAARQTEKYTRFAQSWQEQRDYITAALDKLPPSLRDEAQAAIDATEPQQPDLNAAVKVESNSVTLGGFDLRFDDTGAITQLADSNGYNWADETRRIAALHYELFSVADYERFYEQYIRNRDTDEIRIWARPDYTKQGMPQHEHCNYPAQLVAIHHSGDSERLIVELTMPPESIAAGAPRHAYLQLTASGSHQLEIDLHALDKRANRIAEALWLSFNPSVPQPDEWRLHKLGQRISPQDVVSKGGRTLHAVENGAYYDHAGISAALLTLDAPLIAPGQPSLLDFHNRLPDLSQGLHVNLFNNTWGTNFQMWHDQNVRARFVLQLDASGVS